MRSRCSQNVIKLVRPQHGSFYRSFSYPLSPRSPLSSRPKQHSQHSRSFTCPRNSQIDLQKTLRESHSVKDDTIYALSTAPGRAAIAIIRISGPACLDVYKTLCPNASPLKPRYASLRSLHASNSEVLDASALTLYFPSPRSATGEDILEFHVHGGPATIKAVLAAISELKSSPGSKVRYAEPGEYTRRAFYNNRLDLTQIEALGDSLAAETEQQRRLAVQGTTSSLTQRYESWRQMLLAARGELEALIDFSEDQHFDESPLELMSNISKHVAQLDKQINLAIINSSRGELLRNGIKVALLGSPNVGKSSLLNRIVGREAAIVSKEAGTTRDVVEINVDIGGYFCNFGDLAGVRATDVVRNRSLQNASQSEVSLKKSFEYQPTVGEIESEGIRRAKKRVLSADVIIIVLAVPTDSSKSTSTRSKVHIDDEILEVLNECDFNRQKLLCVCNKIDLAASGFRGTNLCLERKTESKIRVTDEVEEAFSKAHALSCLEDDEIIPSQVRQEMMDLFLAGLKNTFKEMTSALDPELSEHGLDSNPWQDSLGATQRQRHLLQECRQHLDLFLALDQSSQTTAVDNQTADEEEVDIVVAAEHLRAAANCLGRIMGRGESGDVEEVLGVVFEKFCVGK